MSKIRNRERVQELQSQLINEIKTFIPKSGELVFRNSFAVFIQMDYDDHYETEKILIYSLLKDGTLSTDGDSIKLEELSIYELAYILDMLENNLFHIDNEDDE
jgi:hypothetical protein